MATLYHLPKKRGALKSTPKISPFFERQFPSLSQMQWAYCGIQKTREDTVSLNLVGARSLEGLDSCILTNFLVDHFTAWRAVERFFSEFFGFLFNNTCWYYLCI